MLAASGIRVIIFSKKLLENDRIITMAGGAVLFDTRGVTANPLVKAMVGRPSEKSRAIKRS